MFKEYFNFINQNSIYSFIFHRHTNDDMLKQGYIFNVHLSNLYGKHKDCIDALIFDYVTKIEIVKTDLNSIDSSEMMSTLLNINDWLTEYDISILENEELHTFIENTVNVKLKNHYSEHGDNAPPKFFIREREKLFLLTKHFKDKPIHFVQTKQAKRFDTYYRLVDILQFHNNGLGIIQNNFNDPKCKNFITLYKLYNAKEDNVLLRIKNDFYGSDTAFFNEFSFHVNGNEFFKVSGNDEYVIKIDSEFVELSTYLCKNIPRLSNVACRMTRTDDNENQYNIRDNDIVYTFIFKTENEILSPLLMYEYLNDIDLSSKSSDCHVSYSKIVANLINDNVNKIIVNSVPLSSFEGNICFNKNVQNIIKIINEKINPMLEILLK